MADWVQLRDAAHAFGVNQTAVKRLVDRGILETKVVGNSSGGRDVLVNIGAPSSRMQRTISAWALAADTASVIAFLITVNATYDQLSKAIVPASQPSLPTLLVNAMLTAVLGGVLWYALRPYLGLGNIGDDLDRKSAACWAIISNLPVVSVLIWTDLTYGLTDHVRLIAVISSFLIGIAISSSLFWAIPLCGHIGIKSYYTNKIPNYKQRTTYITLWWSILLSFGSYLPIAFTAGLFGITAVNGVALGAVLATMTLLTASFMVITTLICLQLIHGDDHYDPLISVVTGVTLRSSLFLGLYFTVVA